MCVFTFVLYLIWFVACAPPKPLNPESGPDYFVLLCTLHLAMFSKLSSSKEIVTKPVRQYYDIIQDDHAVYPHAKHVNARDTL